MRTIHASILANASLMAWLAIATPTASGQYGPQTVNDRTRQNAQIDESDPWQGHRAGTPARSASLTTPGRGATQRPRALPAVAQTNAPQWTVPHSATRQPEIPRPSIAQPTTAQPTRVLRTYPVPAVWVDEIAMQLNIRYRDYDGVTAAPDKVSGRLVVMASPAIQAEIDGVVANYLQKEQQRRVGAGEVIIRHHVRFVSPATVEALMVTLAAGGTEPSVDGTGVLFQISDARIESAKVHVDRSGGIVTIVVPPNDEDAWRRIIETIDRPSSRPGDVIDLVRIHRASPAPIQRTIRLWRDLLDSSDASPRPGVQASDRAARSVRTVAFQQDAAGGDAVDRQGPATQGGGNQGDAREALGAIGDVEIEIVPDLGTIILKGPKRDVARIREIIRQIEEQSEITQPDVDVLLLEHADADAVANLLGELYEDVLSARQGDVTIRSLGQPNALLLIGRAEALDSLRELIAKIDTPVGERDRLRVYRLRHASAVDAEETIRSFFTDRPGSSDDPRPGLGTRVRIQADYRTNSLIVAASPRDIEEVSRLIDELDVLETAAESRVKVVPLKNAVAEDLVEVIREAISAEEPAGSSENVTNLSTTLSIVRVNEATRSVVKSGILSAAVISADTNANALVVRAPASSIPLITELIRQLDRAPGFDSLVKIFTIDNGDALQLTTALQELFGEEAATAGTSIGAANQAGLPPLTAGGESSLVPLRFSTDQRSNSILVSGSAEDLEVVESILLRLDTAGFAERITEVIWLRYQDAPNVANALAGYVQQRAQGQNLIQQYQQGLGPYDLSDRDLIVVPEEVSNSILISASPRIYEDVRRLIDSLDRRRPMVLIKTVIAEVSLTDRFEIGGEVGLQDALLFDRGVAAGALPSDPGFNFGGTDLPNENQFGRDNLAAQGITSFGVGVATAGADYGGFVLSAANESISLLFRTLQEANRLQILSRPQVMTVDNTEGFVQVGREIAQITGVINNGGLGGIQVVTEPRDIGLILRVRPRVGSDGLIIMDIDATRSSRDATQGTVISTDENGVPIQIDDILITTAQGNITAYSGQTVVFGGLIQKERTNVSRRVPYLSNIPVLGYLFKFDRETEIRNELLVVMTPLVVTGEEDLEYVKQIESSRMSWCLADVVEMHGDVGLSGGYGLWGPITAPTIYPDLQPTIDDVRVVDDRIIDSVIAPTERVGSGGVGPGTMAPPSIRSQPTMAPPQYGPPRVDGNSSSIIELAPPLLDTLPAPAASRTPPGMIE